VKGIGKTEMTYSIGTLEGKTISAGSDDSRHEAKPDLTQVKTTQEANVMLDFLSEVGKKASSVTKLEKLVKYITRMTKQTFNAQASSVLLLDDEEKELRFAVTEGESKKVLKQMRLSTQSGIAGWVVRHGKPTIVNHVAEDSRFNNGVDETTGFITRSVICAPLAVHRKVIGVIEVLNKLDGSDFTKHNLETLMSVASTAAMAIENTKLHQSILDAYKSTIKALAAAIDAKDHYTRGHSQRVMEYALLGGISLSLPQEELEILEYAGLLHDIGKIGIADGVLSKPERLTDQEWEIMRRHPQIGSNMLKDISFLEKARTLVLHHHERCDGNGYPDRLKHEDIPIGARLLAVADALDTMTTNRSYRTALGIDYAIKELYRCSGTQFCPVAVSALISGYNTHAERLPNFVGAHNL